jgi:hypothetical protein
MPVGADAQEPVVRPFSPIDEPEPIPIETLLAAGAPPENREAEYAPKHGGAGVPPSNSYVAQSPPAVPAPAGEDQAAAISQARAAGPSKLISTLDVSAGDVAADREGSIAKGSGERIELAPQPPLRGGVHQAPMPSQDIPPAQPNVDDAPKPEKKAKKLEVSLPEGEFLKMFPDARPDYLTLRQWRPFRLQAHLKIEIRGMTRFDV